MEAVKWLDFVTLLLIDFGWEGEERHALPCMDINYIFK